MSPKKISSKKKRKRKKKKKSFSILKSIKLFIAMHTIPSEPTNIPKETKHLWREGEGVGKGEKERRRGERRGEERKREERGKKEVRKEMEELKKSHGSRCKRRWK